MITSTFILKKCDIIW